MIVLIVKFFALTKYLIPLLFIKVSPNKMSLSNYCKLCGSNTFERLGKIRTNKIILANKILECSTCGFVFLNDDSHISSTHYKE